MQGTAELLLEEHSLYSETPSWLTVRDNLMEKRNYCSKNIWQTLFSSKKKESKLEFKFLKSLSMHGPGYAFKGVFTHLF